jgi:hypothetical protein
MFDVPLTGDAAATTQVVAEWRDLQEVLLLVSTYLPVMFESGPGGVQIPRVAARLRNVPIDNKSHPQLPATLRYAGLALVRDICAAVVCGGLRALRVVMADPFHDTAHERACPVSVLGAREIFPHALQLRPVFGVADTDSPARRRSRIRTK